ncbi:MAG: purine-nucleoside phosphorylase [Cyclobacteriaceae bacterium]
MRKEPKIGYAEKINHAVSYLQKYLPESTKTGIILGTGLGSLVNDIETIIEINYGDIPYFPVSTVESHQGKMIFGKLEGKPILAMKGRFHYYEGYSMKEVTFPIRIFKKLGIENLLISNASGGLNPHFKVGELMIIQDHIDLFPENPLRGNNLEEFGSRFPDMSEPYDPGFISIGKKIAEKNHLTVHQGVYAGVQGPNLETPSEYKYLRSIGADAVGMSTIPEVIVAVHCNLKVFALSAITDLCSPGNIKKITLKEVLAAAAIAEPDMKILLLGLLREI